MRTALLLLTSLCCCALVHGQTQGPVISVNVTADTTKPPEVIRLIFKLYAKGADMDAAKTALVAAEKKLLTKLGEAGAEVIVAHAGISMSSQNLIQRYSQISSQLMSRGIMNPNGQPNDKSNPSFLERTLTIDMRPKVKTKEALSLLTDIQEQTRKNYQDWSGVTDAFKEDMEKLANMNNNNGNFNNLAYLRSNDQHYYQQDVRFQMAAKVTREDRLKLYQEALRRARSLGQDLAEAAEMKLGSLHSINTTYTNVQSYANYNNPVTAIGDVAKFPITIKEDGSETLAIREVQAYQNNNAVGPISFQITLNTSFKLEPK
jgi:Protein of unknown function (DUF541)